MYNINLIDGDILQKGLHFFRVCNIGSDVVANEILFNPKTNRLQISHSFTYVEWNQIGDNNLYKLVEPGERMSLLELIKRKYKLQKLDNLSSKE